MNYSICVLFFQFTGMNPCYRSICCEGVCTKRCSQNRKPKSDPHPPSSPYQETVYHNEAPEPASDLRKPESPPPSHHFPDPQFQHEPINLVADEQYPDIQYPSFSDTRSNSDSKYPSFSDTKYPTHSDSNYPSHYDYDSKYPSHHDSKYPSHSVSKYPSHSDSRYPSHSQEDSLYPPPPPPPVPYFGSNGPYQTQGQTHYNPWSLEYTLKTQVLK